MVDFETSSSKSGLEIKFVEKTSFSKTMALQREPFLTTFYTINPSPLLVATKGFKLIIILSNYQCPLPSSLLAQHQDHWPRACSPVQTSSPVLSLPSSKLSIVSKSRIISRQNLLQGLTSFLPDRWAETHQVIQDRL